MLGLGFLGNGISIRLATGKLAYLRKAFPAEFLSPRGHERFE